MLPDIASYGKIVGGGGPLGCVGGKAEYMDLMNPRNKGQANYSYVNGTLHGNPVAAVAGMATLAELKKPSFYGTSTHWQTTSARRVRKFSTRKHTCDRDGQRIPSGRSCLWTNRLTIMPTS